MDNAIAYAGSNIQINIHSFHINHAGGFVHAGEYGDVA